MKLPIDISLDSAMQAFKQTIHSSMAGIPEYLRWLNINVVGRRDSYSYLWLYTMPKTTLLAMNVIDSYDIASQNFS